MAADLPEEVRLNSTGRHPQDYPQQAVHQQQSVKATRVR